ncbi:type II secretion system F family protein [Pseudomonas sp. MAFF 302030]|jgi:tight adherence protein B|uniref:Type II secretion system F family protein n=1 Tax=Pseudomonas morbosilactucae TaxID=2938197 RepID=A0A9X2C714_9PSED|nr:type II secretion system F family protein [Pseudomonas morbosilactucae]MCK9799340.1 type II secretion system F family protein [Pseudomonas morbosilactucae]
MDALLDLFTLLVFALVLLVFFIARSLNGRRRREQDTALRMSQLKTLLENRDTTSAKPSGALGDAQDVLRQLENPPLGTLPLVGPAFARLWLNLRVLGWHKTLRMRLTLLVMASLMIAVLLGRDTPMPLLFGSLFGLLAFFGIGNLLYRSALAKHLKELKLSLPQAIDAITRTARAGVPISNAFTLVAENIPGPLAVEFALIDNWLRLGVPLRQVMQDSTLRVPLNEYRFFAVILIINQEAGGRLGETLDRLSATLRERHELQLKIQAKTSEARASAKIVGALVPLSLGYMYLNSPKDFHFLLNDPTGNSVLFYAFGSVTLGLLITHLMVRRVL